MQRGPAALALNSAPSRSGPRQALRVSLFLVMLGLAVVLVPGTSRADEVDIAFAALEAAGTPFGVTLGTTEKALAKSLVRCAISGKTVLHCAREELIKTLPPKAQPFARCLLEPGASADACARQVVISELPPQARGLADCIARKADVVSCSREFALDQGQTTAFAAIDKLKADARSELGAPHSGQLRNIICIAKAVKEEDWGSLTVCMGTEAAKIAGKALVRVFLPGPLLALAPLLDPIVDATIQNRVDLFARLVAAARAGDETGLAQVLAEGYLYLSLPGTAVLQACAAIPSFAAKERICSAAFRGIGAFSAEFGGRVVGGVHTAFGGDPLGGAAEITSAPLAAGCEGSKEAGLDLCQEAQDLPLVGPAVTAAFDLFNLNCKTDENVYPGRMAVCRAHAAFYKLQDPKSYNKLEEGLWLACRKHHEDQCNNGPGGGTPGRLDKICNPLRDRFRLEAGKLADDLKAAAARYASTYPPFTVDLEPGGDCDARASQQFIQDCLDAMPSPGVGAKCGPGKGINPASIMNVCIDAAFVGKGSNLRLAVRATCRWRCPDGMEGWEPNCRCPDRQVRKGDRERTRSRGRALRARRCSW